jgi:hypothetical protein
MLQNNPLYLKSYVQVEDQLKFHYIVHCSLDAVEEKGARIQQQHTCRATMVL